MLLDDGRTRPRGHALRGDAGVHPLRRVPQRVPGVPHGRRPRLRLRRTRARWARSSRRCCRAAPEGRDLPFASSLCGACTEACPVGIPLADLLVRLRADLRAPGSPRRGRPGRTPPAGPAVPPADRGRHRHAVDGHPWAPPRRRRCPARARRPRLGRARLLWATWARTWTLAPRATGRRCAFARVARPCCAGTGGLRRAPVARAAGRPTRDLPLPAPRSFHDLWAERHRPELGERPRSSTALLAGLAAQSCVVHAPVDGGRAPAAAASSTSRPGAERRRRGRGAARRRVARRGGRRRSAAVVAGAAAGATTVGRPARRRRARRRRGRARRGRPGHRRAGGRARRRPGPRRCCRRSALLVVPASVSSPTCETAFGRLAADGLPSQVVWVSGPSRTGDLEMILTFGVHGRRRLVHVAASSPTA